MPPERLQKILARAGYGSRRSSEEIIAAGRVRVNGKIAAVGDKADLEQDRILVDGKPIKLPEQYVYIALNKPRGVISSVKGPDPRPTVVDLVDVPEQVYPVGRLDVDSEGLILLTNDGELANRLTHPRYQHEKEYRVLVARHPDDEQLETWRRGVVLEDGTRTQPAEVRVTGLYGKGAWLRVILKEGRKRQIRETGSQLGLPVVKIIRVRIGSLELGSLRPREWRHLTPQEVTALKKGEPYRAAEKPGPAARRRPAREQRPAEERRPSTRRRPGGPGKPAAGRKPASGRGPAAPGRPAGSKPRPPRQGGDAGRPRRTPDKGKRR